MLRRLKITGQKVFVTDIPIEIGTASNSNQTVRVGEFTEHPNLVVVLKAGSHDGHRAKSLLQLCKHSQSVDC